MAETEAGRETLNEEGLDVLRDEIDALLWALGAIHNHNQLPGRCARCVDHLNAAIRHGEKIEAILKAQVPNG